MQVLVVIASVQAIFAGTSRASPAAVNAESAYINSVQNEKRADPVFNELINGGCKKVIAIYARGTTAPGNYGDAVGPGWFSGIVSLEGGTKNVVRQGVTYDAAWAGYLDGGSDDGGKMMASLIAKAVKQCPSAKLVLGGYSQGAQVVHKALGQVSSANAGAIDAITVFGDPYGTKAIPKVASSKVKKWCHADDNVCHDFPVIPNGAHQGYNGDIASAIKFIDSKI